MDVPVDTAMMPDTGGMAFMALAPCNAESDYVTGNMITFPTTVSPMVYTPNCLRVAAGTTVTWMGNFMVHPLAPSTRGTVPNPIPLMATGTTQTVTFTTPGFYPFYCTAHGTNEGTGMAGVVWVTP